jgi:type II secretory pathway component PulF
MIGTNMLLTLTRAPENAWPVGDEAVIIGSLFALLVVAISIVVLVSRSNPDSKRWYTILAQWTFAISAVALWLALAYFVPFGVYVFILGVFFIAAVTSFGVVSERAVASYVMSTIGSSIRQNLPLPMAIESAAIGLKDERGRVLRRINKWLIKGYCLSEAIKRGYPKCRSRTVAMIAAAEKIDQLPLALKAIEADIVEKADESQKIQPVHPAYPVIVITVVILLVLGVTTFVLPQFSYLLTEMLEGQPPPIATRIILRGRQFLVEDVNPFVWLSLGVICLAAITCEIRTNSRRRRPHKPFLVSRVGDFIKWHLPILHWFEKNYSTVQTVELLRLSLNAGCTVDNAIANTLDLDVNYCFRAHLKEWLAKVRRGNNIAQAATNSKLPDSLAWAFDDKVNKGNAPSILEMLEAVHRSNYGYGVNLARFILWPCVTIMLGMMVGFVAYAIYSPMILIISGLTSSVVP